MAAEGDSHQSPKSRSSKECANGYLAKIGYLSAKYSPYVTGVASAGFYANVMSPLTFQRPFGSYNVAAQNVCFGIAHIGTGLCIHSRICQRNTHSCAKSGLVSATGSVLFNYGTLLLMANIKHYLPNSQLLRCAVGLGVLAYVLWIGKEYLELISDEQCPVD